MKKPVKIIVCGSGAIGKTTICQRLVGTLNERNLPSMTPGIDLHKFEMKEQNHIIAALWDLGGQERFRFVQDAYMKGAKIIIFVVSLEWFHSVKDLRSWIQLIPPACSKQRFFLIANKADSSRRMINKEDLLPYIEEYNMIYHEVSALTGQGFDAFQHDLKEEIKRVHQAQCFFPPIQLLPSEYQFDIKSS